MKNIRPTNKNDRDQIDKLLNNTFGPGRYARSVYRLREIRPFVENKQAKSSEYLSSITPKIDSNKQINLKTKLN